MPETILEIRKLDAHYGDFQALYGVDMAVSKGEVLAIIGANGAGKTTLMRSITGLLTNGPASTSLSGGQQQMVAIGRALMANPDLILFDEISLGLAPIIIKDIYDALPDIIGEGMSALIVEQDITKALSVSNRVCCLQEGRVSLEGDADKVSREEISHAYFGIK